jgi:hypothetical protein
LSHCLLCEFCFPLPLLLVLTHLFVRMSRSLATSGSPTWSYCTTATASQNLSLNLASSAIVCHPSPSCRTFLLLFRDARFRHVFAPCYRLSYTSLTPLYISTLAAHLLLDHAHPGFSVFPTLALFRSHSRLSTDAYDSRRLDRKVDGL